MSVIKHLDLGTGVALITICNTLFGTMLLNLSLVLQGEHGRGWAGKR